MLVLYKIVGHLMQKAIQCGMGVPSDFESPAVEHDHLDMSEQVRIVENACAAVRDTKAGYCLIGPGEIAPRFAAPRDSVRILRCL